jgi:hypothetical protein
MKRTTLSIVLVLVVIIAVLSGGCIRKDISEEAGNTATREFDYTGFTRIEVGHAFKVDISRSDNYSISVTINENRADSLKVSKTGDTLKIGFKEPFLNIRSAHNRPQVTITLPYLRGLDISGAVEANVKGFKSSVAFTLDVSGASNLDIDMEAGDFKANISGASGANGYLKARSTDIKLSGASHITIPGSGGDIIINASGASQAYLENYPVFNADIVLSGASISILNASGKLNADLSGASRLEYTGNPTLGRIDISGGATVKPNY